MKKIAAIIKAFIPNEGQYVEAAKGRLELLNLIHIKVHKLEFLEFLKEELEADSKDNIEKELELLESVHERVHRLWSSEIFKVGLESSGRLKDKRLWKLESDYEFSPGSFSDFRNNLKQKLKFSKEESREFATHDLIQAIADRAEFIEARFNERGLGLVYYYLVGLCHYCGDKPIQDYFEPLKDENGFCDLHGYLASKILERVKAERQARRWEGDGQSEELTSFNPPLTFEEVLFYFIENYSPSREKLLRFFPTVLRHCLECDRLFSLSKNNPGYFRCPKCSTKIRQRRRRGGKALQGVKTHTLTLVG